MNIYQFLASSSHKTRQASPPPSTRGRPTFLCVTWDADMTASRAHLLCLSIIGKCERQSACLVLRVGRPHRDMMLTLRREKCLITSQPLCPKFCPFSRVPPQTDCVLSDGRFDRSACGLATPAEAPPRQSAPGEKSVASWTLHRSPTVFRI